MNRSSPRGALFFVASGVLFAGLGAFFAAAFRNSFRFGSEHDPDDLTRFGASAALAAYGIARVAAGLARARSWSRSGAAMGLLSLLDIAIAVLSCVFLLATGAVFYAKGALLAVGAAYLGVRHLLLLASFESVALVDRPVH